MTNVPEQNKIIHVAFVVDRSGSMRIHEQSVIKVVDNQVAYLANLSKSSNMETRVSVYIFDDVIENIIFDMDVLRLPSIAPYYKARGQTALIDATILAQSELAQTCRIYGDHSFLIFVFTDGQENVSPRRAPELRNLLNGLPMEWTVGILVPDINGKIAAQGCGFPAGNISIWNTVSATGVEEAGAEMQAATQSYFNMRAKGQTGTRTLFSTDANAVNADTIRAAGLKPLDSKKYNLVPVVKPKEAKGEGVLNKDKHRVWEISDFVRHATGSFRVGTAYYELSKKEKIQGNKELVIFEIATGNVYVGDGVRAMIGLPDTEMSVAPDFNPKYKIFVQSSSTNRHLVVGTKVLILN